MHNNYSLKYNIFSSKIFLCTIVTLKNIITYDLIIHTTQYPSIKEWEKAKRKERKSPTKEWEKVKKEGKKVLDQRN